MRHDEEDSATKLIITPYLDDPNGSLNVLEINYDNSNKTILSPTFQLDRKKGKSTAREFIERFKDRISSLDENSNDDLTGFWVGVLDIRDKLQLVILDVQQDKKSEFVLMLNGVSGTNETYFNEENILVD